MMADESSLATDDLVEIDDLSEIDLPAAPDVIELRPTAAERNQRLDKFLATHLPELSRSHLQQLIEEGHVRVDGIARRQTFKMTPGQVVTAQLPPAAPEEIEPEPMPLAIVYEDADVLVIDKPAGMVVHPAPGHPQGTLVNAVVAHAPEISIAGSNRPGIVHRLDKETSGLIAIAKTDRARTSLVRQWQQRTVQKEYVALVTGVVEPERATIDVPIGRDPIARNRMAAIAGGREAVTHIRVRERFGAATLLDVDIETGRTHQIRVHLAFIGHPVVGDAVYNRRSGPFGGAGAIVDRQFLHASRLAFELPDGRRITLQSPLPGELSRELDVIRGA